MLQITKYQELMPDPFDFLQNGNLKIKVPDHLLTPFRA
jgi:hypothetical protein